MINEDLLKKAQSLPRKPGCYLMKNSSGDVLYVGKAKDLKNRVASYFNKTAKSVKTEILVSKIKDFDFIMTGNETEAFVLENNLIKKHGPKYNIQLRDDKSYPYVLVDFNEEFPRLHYVRRFKRGKGKEFFGPFVVGSNISEVLRILQKQFTLRDCSLPEFKRRKMPCLLYQMKQCSAPCVNLISKENYLRDLNLALNFLKGKGVESAKLLEKKMEDLAEREDFEAAALLRDDLSVLKKFLDYSLQQNTEIFGREKNVDIISVFKGEVEVDIALFMIRNGVLLGHKNFHFPTIEILEDFEEEILAYIFQYYSQTQDTYPDYIIIPFSKTKLELLQAALNSFGQFRVKGKSQKYKSLIELTQKQAFEHQRVRLTHQESVYLGLAKLKELLSMKERPVRLECYDVAIWQGKSPTASQITFIDGKPDKSNYRHYNLTELPEGNNDFAMLREVMRRRIKHGNFPDVFIVDGGKGQVSAFLEVLKEFRLEIPVVGIAKAKSLRTKKTEERLIIPGRANPYILNKNMALFKIIVQIRDEAHRFSRRLHHKKEESRSFASWIDEVKGIGPITKKKILKKLDKSIDELKEMGAEEFRSHFDLTEKQARLLIDHLNKNSLV